MLRLRDCPACGYVTEASVAICPSCGGAMQEGSASIERAAAPAPSPRRRSGVLRWVGILLVPTLLAIGFIGERITSARRDASGAVVSAGTGDVFDLRVGDCMNGWDEEEDEVSDANLVPCSQPHEYEVYANVTHPGGASWPGNDALWEFGDTACFDPFEGYVGVSYAESELYFSYLYPTQVSWEEGDRVFNCVLFLEQGLLTGSMRGTAR